ncbi:alpha-2-macroglobulin [Lutibacter sp. B1]|uniref:alpha-2-macroglobulin family protein n=1 Tax=Lutibacter sp. B1 TaxID=2725996 RepID=UPI001456773F|nr:MG2 domain-containing protein [Lutibacter sp. B1]NLP58798.1 alpha-2-macroglobulin [Lutibacter sp. B1]
MKKAIILFLVFIFSIQLSNAQTPFDSYKKDWDKVYQFELESLPKSALIEVEKIFIKAKKENNTSQLVKTLLYKSKFALTLEEDAQLKVIENLKSEISQSNFPSKNMLENVLANMYWQYFQQNRWKFYNRTKTSEKIDTTDFRTWDLATIFTEIQTHFQKSLENGLLAQQYDLNTINDILQLQKDSKIYRPTLYDFLAHNALDFFEKDERYLSKPAYKFEINNPDFLENNTSFLNADFTSKDKQSNHLYALKIYKNLTLFHSKDNNPTALIDVTLKRLHFVKNNYVLENKDSIYLNTLQQLKSTYQKNETSTEIDFEIAHFYNELANTYHPKDNKVHRFKRKEALEICEQAFTAFPKSQGAEKCLALKNQILKKYLAITSEKYIPINTPSRLLINYKNIDKLYFKTFKITKIQMEAFNKIYNDSAKIDYLKNLKLLNEWKSDLKNENDFQQHSTEILVPEFSNGNYLIFASTEKEFNAENSYATNYVQITDLVLIENNNKTYQVVNRNTGKPIKNAKINLKNYRTGDYNKPLNKNFVTNKNGQFTFNNKEYYRNVVATVTYKDDTATFGDYYLYKYDDEDTTEEDEEILIKPFVFTDRSIYRPGQTVYFKAILLKKQGDKTSVFTNEYVEILLEDLNGQEVKQLDLKLNEFGSVSGEFILPSYGLTGEYTIYIDESYEYDSKFYDNADYDFDFDTEFPIAVEEYKRPKFETSFKPITETFTLNDSITVNGNATAFAGSTISDAKVSYRVVRTAQFPRWYSRTSFYSEEMEITHGETSTNAEGNYKITFKAIPDTKILPEDLPTFNYKVYADVTDINGETRSAETNVKVGYHTMEASISIDSNINKLLTNNKITINTKNLNGEFVPAKGMVRIYKLKAPKKPLRERPWNAPDYEGFSKEEFKQLFPHDPYTDDEGDENNWEKGTLVFEKEFNTEKPKEILLVNTQNWTSGKYIIIATCEDKFGKPVKDEQRFTVFSTKDKQVADSKLFFINTDKISYLPNDEVLLKIGSASKDITVTIFVEKQHKIIDSYFIHLNNETKTLKIPVTKEDIGGFAIKYHYVNYNSFENGTANITVPFDVDKLSIETLTFRDKLQPGSEQTWSFKIKGSEKEKVTAEILASMYDASLDEFKAHQWNFNPINPTYYYTYNNSSANKSFGTNRFNVRNLERTYFSYPTNNYDELNWFGFGFYNNLRIRGISSAKTLQKGNNVIEIVEDSEELEDISFMEISENDSLDEVVVVGYGMKKDSIPQVKLEPIDFSSVKIRKNFNETAFFFPHLTTDKEGTISFNFTVPEALTRWKLQLLAHTKEVKSATKTLTTITQKELMVLPNPPRFLREGDKIVFSSKISNLTEQQIIGIAQLQLTDAITNKDITKNLLSLPSGEMPKAERNFTIDAKGNTSVSWFLTIPENIQAVQYKIVAKAGDFSDGEQNALPVLSNRMLVTETLPMWIKSNETKTFTLDKLKNTSTPLSDQTSTPTGNQTSTTLSNHKLTLEVTSNPAWYAVQALPYLMEYPYECSEQTFARYYANILATHIANSNPRIQEVFNQWKNSGALLSNLEKKEELKSIIIQETPWLRDAQSETEQKKRIALLFDLNKMKNEAETTLTKLAEMQFNNGGFPWFKGNRYPNRFITQHIASGFGHLRKLGIISSNTTSSEVEMSEKIIKKTVNFLDIEIVKDYTKLLEQAQKIKERAKTKAEGIKAEKEFLAKNHLGHFQLQYLYMRSFYPDISQNDSVKTASNYYLKQAAEFWKDFNLYSKGLIALVQHRISNKTVSEKILKSLKENSITNEELGMYWKENTASWYWFQAPIETQALLIEAFSEIENNTETIDNLKIWLLKNKQTNRWATTKSTTEAVYALLLQGTNWLKTSDFLGVQIGNKKINPLALEETKIEAGTGYFKTSFYKNEIVPEMATVTLTKNTEGIAWGALYWQYFEDLDKITSAETPLKLSKKLFLKKHSDTGEELVEIKPNSTLKIGDLITVRIELKVDRAMEFVHMKDMRASGLEPVSVLSQYKWQDGLGYYESTKDASTNFFFDDLPKGVYVFEYDLRVNNKGDFSNGITTIQSMYAPEFSSHSEGVRVTIE